MCGGAGPRTSTPSEAASRRLDAAVRHFFGLCGNVVIQTYTPDNYAILAAAQHDFEGFFAHEVELRREQAYPPFVRLARLVYAHGNAEYGHTQAEKVGAAAASRRLDAGPAGCRGAGPGAAASRKWHGRTRWQLTLRAPDPVELLRVQGLARGGRWISIKDRQQTAKTDEIVWRGEQAALQILSRFKLAL